MRSRSLSILSVGLMLSGAAFAQERLVPKQLSGPIEEAHTGVMARANPLDAAIHSKTALIAVNLAPTKSGDWRWQGELAVDSEAFSLVMFSGQETWDVNLRHSLAKAATPAHLMAVHMERGEVSFGNSAFEGDYYRIERARPGQWAVSVEADGSFDGQGYLLYGSESPYRLLSYKADTPQLVGEKIGFVGYGYRQSDDGPKTRMNLGLVDKAWLRVTAPSGEVFTQAMVDDGGSGDGLAGDGMFAGAFVAKAAGEYQVQMIAEGTTPEGHSFLRTAQHVVPVIAGGLQPAWNVVTASPVSDQRVELSLAVSNAVDAPQKYRVFAEVWGVGADGEMKPVNWIGGMSYVDNGRLTLGLDLRWLGRAGVESGIELRNVRIEDPDLFIPVSEISKMTVDMPSTAPIGRALSKTIDESMLMGPRPAMANAKAGSRLLLVHGYCSGNAWGPVAGQFSNESIFLDTNKNRSHDQFANLIAAFGSPYSSYGIVAHSQGGAAALHLYTYYWSGLDNASGGRLIQSVGTPYQGTALAGNAAALGSVFGVGCGTNNDLTYSGASSWLSGIPGWARSKVNYYTTSFTDKWWRPDHCNVVTDLLLSDPEDGTTERSKGQLSGAVNRGHKTGWCHTTGMRDPAQVLDGSRNSVMNSNAAN